MANILDFLIVAFSLLEIGYDTTSSPNEDDGGVSSDSGGGSTDISVDHITTCTPILESEPRRHPGPAPALAPALAPVL